MTPLLPLCTREELQAELADVDRQLARALSVTPVSAHAVDRKWERIAGLRRWKTSLEQQLAARTFPSAEVVAEDWQRRRGGR